jgi:hypothetical protein
MNDSKYPFQRLLIHGSPYPSETARVYSTLRLHERDIKGVVTFGAVEVALNEVLVVCTDGIPEREIFVRDLSDPAKEEPDSPGLCRWLFQTELYDNSKLEKVLKDYDNSGILFDDATIIVARPVSILVEADVNFIESSSEPSADSSKSVESELSPSPGSALGDPKLEVGIESVNSTEGTEDEEMAVSNEPIDNESSQTEDQLSSSNESFLSDAVEDLKPNKMKVSSNCSTETNNTTSKGKGQKGKKGKSQTLKGK